MLYNLFSGKRKLQIQTLEGGGVYSIWIFHHDPHCSQHHLTHAQGNYYCRVDFLIEILRYKPIMKYLDTSISDSKKNKSTVCNQSWLIDSYSVKLRSLIKKDCQVIIHNRKFSYQGSLPVS